MSDYQHPVFFEAGDLSAEDLRKIRHYFTIKRQSGGGECGEVEKLRENVYKICFKLKTVQERVLSKTDHTVHLPRQGSLQISLRPHDIKEDDKKARPPASSDQQVASGGKPLEKVFKLDLYLLQFLKDNPKAFKDLDMRLSDLYCSFKLDPDCENIVVTRGAFEPFDDDIAQQKWETQVQMIIWKLQSQYEVYYEVEPEKVKILKQNPLLSTRYRYLGIYIEEDMSVIVGESNEIKEFLDSLQLQKQTSKEYSLTEIQYALVKELFDQELKSNFKVKSTRERPNSVVLKGPEEQVQSAGKKLQELVNQIQKQRIQLDQASVKFLSSSGAVQKFQMRFQQSLRGLVLLEINGSDLILLSRSTDALQEAASAVQRDLCVESIPLEQSEAEPPGINTLKDSLRKALQQANQGSTNVEVNYEPGTNLDPRMKVQLVGYSAEVNKLKNIIQDYKKGFVKYSDSLPLPLPEMVDIFFDLLAIAGVKPNNVKLVPTQFPRPRVRLSGPQCQVKDLKVKLDSVFGSFIWDKIEVEGPGVTQFFKREGLNTQTLVQKTFQVMVVPTNNAQTNSPAAWTSLPYLFTAVPSPQKAFAGSSLALEIEFDGLEKQQVDVLVAPMLNSTLNSTKVGNCLSKKAGQQLISNFDAAKGSRRLYPGDVLEVDGTPLGCRKVFFIECEPWSGTTDSSEQALRSGLKQVLALCEQQGWKSVAIPVIGPGPVLSVPIKDATRILTDVIGTFGQTGFTGSLSTIRIMIMPKYSNSEEIFHEVFTGLSAQMVDPTGQAVFQSLSSKTDEITIALGRCQLHLVFGDISNETTDVIVNTTDFCDLGTDVCNDILTVAGPQVQAELRGVRVNKGDIFTTRPGNFPCKLIMHVCGERDANIIKGLAQNIVSKCELDGYQSVAIPAICTGKGGLDARLVAQSILQGVKDATIGANFQHLRSIRIVMRKIHVFLEFKSVAQQIFGSFTQTAAPAPLTPLAAASRGPQPTSLTVDLGSHVGSPPDQQSTAEFLVIGLTAESVSDACGEILRSYLIQCSSQLFSAEEIRHLNPDEIDRIMKDADDLGIKIIQHDPAGFEVTGLTNGVNEITRMIQKGLLRQVRGKEQDILFARVSWCILGTWGDWERLPKEAHYQLENNNGAEGVTDAQGRKWTVDLNKMEATLTGGLSLVAQIKRLENLLDFSFPLYWDNMASGEFIKLVTLATSSAEYRRVKIDFKRTVQKTVLKIERVQNIHLRRAYEVRKRELEEKNGPPVGAGEKALYHGTTSTACLSIQNTNFDRRFAGQNATRFGLGTYFALDASYSAHPTFSVPATDGTQLMFVALVLTGNYAQGQRNMRTPPSRSSDPNDRFDSVVDNMQNPQMFVVFHDCQAYPDYLITFK